MSNRLLGTRDERQGAVAAGCAGVARHTRTKTPREDADGRSAFPARGEETMDSISEDRAVWRDFHGKVIGPDDPEYEGARQVYNGMIDKHPGLITQCADVHDVVEAVRFARDRGVPLAMRGGGHNGAGLGTVDDGVVLDLSSMNHVEVDPLLRTVRVGGGCTWGQVDAKTHEHGLAVPCGIISTTGVGGLTLGGGLGHLSRAYGLTIDSLLEAEMVLADGQIVRANESQHPDLFWAIRGGGGNFGVVTSFTFRGHPVKNVFGGPMFWSLDEAADVMRKYHEFILSAPLDVTAFFAFMTVPPVAPFPTELQGKQVAAAVWCCTGSIEDAKRAVARGHEFGKVLMDGTQEMPFPMLNSAFDAFYPPGQQWYWRADFVRNLHEEAIERYVEYGSKPPTPLSTMHLYPINGQVHRVPKSATAFSFRDATYAEVIVGVDPDPANAGLIRDWTVEYWEAVHPYSAGGAYVNFMMNEGQARVQATYQDNYSRLTRVKANYDPGNLFRVNQNILPAS